MTLFRANLSGAHLKEASLSSSLLPVANLSEADLPRTNLNDVYGITQEQLNSTCGDERTWLPAGLTTRRCKTEPAPDDTVIGKQAE
ncbi:pentapeptide repeat-containing protein [Geminicoccus sp.]|uniref:pentapeptide repeat-containing protein n=1 Tax=Geminicoccus sp. TaxID=2024832 RepID=UPI0039C87462